MNRGAKYISHLVSERRRIIYELAEQREASTSQTERETLDRQLEKEVVEYNDWLGSLVNIQPQFVIDGMSTLTTERKDNAGEDITSEY